MPTLNFPSSPQVNDTYSANGKTYVWNGSSWLNISSGFTGSKGDLGFTGSMGFTGSQGIIGFTGSKGDIGFTGSKGDIGFTGSQGTTGFTGSLGFTGSKGDIGFTGSQGTTGFTGSKGDIGFTGSVGFTGSKGDIGFTGSQGTTGFTGSKGDIGFTGSKGDIGFTGSQGTTGFTGSKGDIGFTGSKGDIGFTGSVGFTGSKGDIGFTGSLGFTGSQGAGFTGSAGTTGFTGSLGFTGSAGTPGAMTTWTARPGGTVSLTTTSEIQLTTVTIPAGDASRKVLILARTNFTKDTGTTSRAETLRLRRGTDNTGTLLASASSSSGAIASMVFGTASIAYIDSVGASETTYRISAVNFANSTITANDFDIEVIDLTGATGVTGFTGSQGAGFTGSQGTTGFTGSLGFTGSQGAGFTGSQGTTGFTGSLGFTGSQGAGFTGSQGTTGFTGSAGAVSSFTNGADNRVVTATSSTGITGETNLTYDGSTLNLTDGTLQRPVIKDYGETLTTPTISANAVTLNLENSNVFRVTLDANITTLTISNPPTSGTAGSFTLILNITGNFTVTWPASVKWANGTAPTLTTTNGKRDIFTFMTTDGGTEWFGFAAGTNF